VIVVLMKRLYASVTEDVHSSVKSRAARDGKDLTKWVHEAVIEKLDRPGPGDDSRLGPLKKLSEKHRRGIMRYIKFLEECPEEFRDTLDDILKAIVTLQRRVCRRK
jgi:hypothetical protein